MPSPTVRLTLTHDDINTIMGALDMLDEYIRQYEGTADPERLDIQHVEEKLQAARGRMRKYRSVDHA